MSDPDPHEFVEKLLDDWEGDQYQIDGEWGGDSRSEVAARRAEWDALKARLPVSGQPSLTCPVCAMTEAGA